MKSKDLTIEIYGTGTHNRGAELMACSVTSTLREKFPDLRFVVSPYFGSPFERAKYGLLTTWEGRGRLQRLFLPRLFRLLPEKLREALGVVDPREIDLVIDASGFAFSDQWGKGPAFRLLRKMRGKDLKDVPLVLLPQALGSFEQEELKKIAKALFERSDLVYARDKISFEHAHSLGATTEIRLSPDFTIGLSPLPWDGDELPRKYTLIVPNCRMLDRGGYGDVYLNLVRRLYEILEKRGKNPYFLLHDQSEDREVIAKISKSAKILTHRDPRVLKGVLGGADFVLGSRFHALVSALSQGVPCVGIGWSHKYPELFSDFGISEYCPTDLEDLACFESLVSELSDENTREIVARKVGSSLAELKGKNQEMWQEVIRAIERCIS